MTTVLRGDDGFDSAATYISNNQAWVDVIGSRSVGVTYTNNTPNPMQISITGTVHSGATARSMYLYIDGVVSAYGSSAGIPQLDIRTTVDAIIPPGSTYLLSGTVLLYKWAELK